MTLREWTTALPDWEERIVAGRSLMPVGPLFPEASAEAMDVFNNLTLVDAPNGPELLGTLCRPWVKEIAETLFGSLDPEAKKRHITNYFVTVSKKNGKSSLASAVMLTALILNHRPSAEFLILAPTKEIAEAAYKPIRDMIKAEPELGARFHEQWHYKTITDRLNGSVLKVVAADSATVTGKKATGVFIDELHEFGKSAKAAHMLTEATGGLASRPEGFVFYCTTQSSDPPAGVFADKLAYARGVRDGRIVDKRFLPIIYEFPKSWIDAGKHRDVENAYVTNPNWGLSVDADFIRQKMKEAQETGEHAVKDVLSKFMNVEIGMALRANRWLGADYWEATEDKSVTLDEIIRRSEVITVGGDGGGLDDLLGLTVTGRCARTSKKLMWSHAWAHPSVLERNKQFEAQIRDYAKRGDLTLVGNVGDDVLAFAAICKRVHDAGLLYKVGLDPAGVGAILEALDDAGIPADMTTGVSQGWRLGAAIKTAERWLAAGDIQHAAQPLMNWCVGNAMVEPKGNAILITKAASTGAKIDPVMSMLNSIELMCHNPAAAQSRDMEEFFRNPIIL